MFETETMADLLWQQGHGAEALAMGARLADRASGDERARLSAKVATWQGSGPHDGARPRSASKRRSRHESLPPDDGPAVALSLSAGGLTLAWSLPPRAEAPVAELFLVRRTPPDGSLQVQRRTLPLGALEGTLALPVADLHSARAAAGFLETNQFRPLARSSLLQAADVAPRDEDERA